MSDTNLEQLEAPASIKYIDEFIQNYIDGDYIILCVELANNCTILCMVHMDDFPDNASILYMPVQLIESHETTDDGYYKSYYSFTTYNGIASDCSEIILNDIPAVMYTPRSNIILRYMDYWKNVKAGYAKLLNDEFSDFIETDTNTYQ